VCDGIVALLQGGITELAVLAALAGPERVARAFAHCALHSAMLGDLTDANEGDVERVYSHAVLLDGLSLCPTLQHLTVADRELVKMSAIVAKFQLAGGPALQTLELSRAMGLTAQTPGIAEFMQAVAGLPHLTVFKADLSVSSAADLTRLFLAPLRAHPTLATLAIHSEEVIEATLDNVSILPMLMAFGSSCPSLQVLSFESPPLEVDQALAAHLASGAALDDPAEIAAMVRWLAQPECKLRTLVLRGVCVTPAACQAFCTVLAKNVSLRDVETDACLLDLRALVVDLMLALETNLSLESFGLSNDYVDYYLVLPDGTLRGFMSNDTDDEDGGAPRGFTLQPRPAGAQGEDPAELAFAPLKESASTLFLDLPARLARNRRELLSKAAHPPLVENIMSLMNAALMANAPSGNKDDPEQFGLPAALVTAHLSQALALPTAVQSTQVSKAADPLQQHAPGSPWQFPQDLHTLLKIDQETREEGGTARAGQEWRRALQLKAWTNYDEFAETAQLLGDDSDSGEEASSMPSSAGESPHSPVRPASPEWISVLGEGMDLEPVPGAIPPGGGIPVAPAGAPLSVQQAHQLERALRIIRSGGPVQQLWDLVASAGFLLGHQDGNGANQLLMAAAQSGNADLVAGLLERGAQDFGRHGESIAPSREVTAAFRASLPATSTASGTTTTTTSATTTTATATTTTTTSTGTGMGTGKDISGGSPDDGFDPDDFLL
jgi:hypothetical protein